MFYVVECSKLLGMHLLVRIPLLSSLPPHPQAVILCLSCFGFRFDRAGYSSMDIPLKRTQIRLALTNECSPADTLFVQAT